MSIVKEHSSKTNNLNMYEALGFAVSCMLMHSNYSLYHVKALDWWTLEAIKQNQFKRFYDHLDEPLGYITWAYLRDETLNRFVNDPNFILHKSEWNEAGILCILDICCKPGSVRLVIEYMKNNNPISDEPLVVWKSRKSGKLNKKKLKRLP
jgi:cytolysin-activating lysine-acyltransferase